MQRRHPTVLGYYPDVGVFGRVRWLLGDEDGLAAFYTMPDLAHDIMEHVTSLYLTVFEKVAQEVRVDVVHIWEDMCGRQGPLISPRHWAVSLPSASRSRGRSKPPSPARTVRALMPKSITMSHLPELSFMDSLASTASRLDTVPTE